MVASFAKSVVLWGISRGFALPQPPLERVTELTSLKRLVRQLDIDCVLDVGANRGQFASELRRIGYSGLIVSFEPIATEFAALSARFEGDSKWRGHRLALGSADERRPMLVADMTVMSSLLEPLAGTRDCRSEVIEIRRLDALVPQILSEFGVSRLFLKMDTQGFDVEVFKGASGCLEAIHGLQSEISVQPLYKDMPHYLDALAVYEGAGFELYNLSVVNRTSQGGLMEMNCFMRRAQRPQRRTSSA
jgi:FkbM family methyltransferase